MRPGILRSTLCLTLIFASVFAALPAALSAEEGPGSEAAQAAPGLPSQDEAGLGAYSPADPQVAPGLPSEEEASLAAYIQANPQAADAAYTYYWIPGSNFQPRSSAVKLQYAGGGCVSRTGDGGSSDRNAFTAPLSLPDGATILGVRFYSYDTNAADSHLHLFSYDGAGELTDELAVSTSGTPGYVDSYVALPSRISVNNFARSYSMAWYSDAGSSNLRLCGARVFYIAPFPPVGPVTSPAAGAPAGDDPRPAESAAAARYHYSFITGSNFQPRRSVDTYQYNGAGCFFSPSGGTFVIDAGLPEEATLLGVRLYYKDTTATAGLGLWVTTFDGAGAFTDRLWFDNGSAAGGYANTYSSLLTPYVVDQFKESLVLQVSMPAATNVELCGVRLFYSIPNIESAPARAPAAAEGAELAPRAPDAPQASSATKYRYRFVAGSTFQARNYDTAYDYAGFGCVNVTSGVILTTGLQLPDGARLYGVRLFYYDTSTAINSTMYIAEYDGRGNVSEFIDADSSGMVGYGQIYAVPASAYTVDNAAHGLSLVWNPGGALNNTMRLCGMRAYYSVIRPAPVFVPLIRR